MVILSPGRSVKIIDCLHKASRNPEHLVINAYNFVAICICFFLVGCGLVLISLTVWIAIPVLVVSLEKESGHTSHCLFCGGRESKTDK